MMGQTLLKKSAYVFEGTEASVGNTVIAFERVPVNESYLCVDDGDVPNFARALNV